MTASLMPVATMFCPDCSADLDPVPPGRALPHVRRQAAVSPRRDSGPHSEGDRPSRRALSGGSGGAGRVAVGPGAESGCEVRGSRQRRRASGPSGDVRDGPCRWVEQGPASSGAWGGAPTKSYQRSSSLDSCGDRRRSKLGSVPSRTVDRPWEEEARRGIEMRIHYRISINVPD